MQPTLTPTIEASVNERPHPDESISFRLREVALSDCEFGCKIYADPHSNYTVLAHSATYGCRK